jgi:hypothetical protein
MEALPGMMGRPLWYVVVCQILNASRALRALEDFVHQP